MTKQETHKHISYIEIPAINLAASKAFFTTVFGWDFVDYCDSYAAFSNSGMLGGFYSADHVTDTQTGSALVVMYSQSLPESQAEIIAAGGKISQETFSFPGGQRFHFTDPSGNEFAVWSE